MGTEQKVPNVPFSEGDPFPASEATPGQRESRQAYQALTGRSEEFAWWQDYEELRRAGWDWRKAVYIAWMASATSDRQPATQEELAREVLGLTSDRVISKWRSNDTALDDAIAKTAAAPLLRHRREIYEALITVATEADARGHQDRKLALELLGDYKPRQSVAVGNEGGEAFRVEGQVMFFIPENGRGDGAGAAGDPASAGAADGVPK